jgi:hypothetical protein
MTDNAFRIRLTALVNEFIAEGGDAFWCFRELTTCGTQLTDALRCELVETDEEPEEAPY